MVGRLAVAVAAAVIGAVIAVYLLIMWFIAPITVQEQVPLASPGVVRSLAAASERARELTTVPPPEGTIIRAPPGYNGGEGVRVDLRTLVAILAVRMGNDFRSLDEEAPPRDCVEKAPAGYERNPEAPGVYHRWENEYDRDGNFTGRRITDTVTVCGEWGPLRAFREAKDLAMRFALRQSGTATVRRTRTTCDKDGNCKTETYTTDVTVTWYEYRPVEEVLAELGIDPQQYQAYYEAPAEKLGDAHGLLSATGEAPCAPAGWTPQPRSGWVWPVPGVYLVTSCFGPRIHPIERTNGFHAGLDVGAPMGAPVVAAVTGTVTRAGESGNCGLSVQIQGDGYRVKYCHLSRISVRPGTRVAGGAVVGLVGSTGRSTGPHLHYEVYTGLFGLRLIDPITLYRG